MESPLLNNLRKILVVDDDPASHRIVTKALEWNGYQVAVAESGEEAIEKMNHWNPHLVLLDVSMPGLNGIETLRFLRQQKEYVSIIFVSGRSETEDVIRGLDAGADDYVRKPFDTLELLARVRSQLRIKVLHDELKQANTKLQELVDIDDLTGLFNMRSLYEKLDFERNRASRYKRTVCVMMLDMDNFKNVNDNNDHLFGSYVLSEIGKIIKMNIRKIDFAARYGGDEFLVVLTEIGLKGAQVFAERLRQGIGEHKFESDGHFVQQTVSIGFAITDPDNAKVDARTLVRFADRALYEAKESGKNCVKFYDFKQESSPKAVKALQPRKVVKK